jgi:pimeloyl-ACP methyl ester carboxylesterase
MRVLAIIIACVAYLLLASGCATPPSTSGVASVVIERQGSFYVGGRQVTAAGTYDATTTQVPLNPGQTFWVDQMYVQYQIPPGARRLPIILVHGGAGTGRVWESTPDGRDGYQTIFLRRGYAVYIVDAPRGGRSGFPSFSGALGWLDDRQQVVPDQTFLPGNKLAWTRWRIGPQFPDVFSVQAFPMSGLDQFMQAIRPVVSDDPEVVSRALIALLDKIGPAILVTHSNSGLWGWLAAAGSNNVRAVVSYEPSVVFPAGEMPSPIALYRGTQDAGTPVTNEQFARLATIPIQVVFGDNIPSQPVADLPADGRRAQIVAAQMFADALNRQGGRVSVLRLPDAGLRGNSHFAFSDLNNVEVADLLSSFLANHRLDSR